MEIDDYFEVVLLGPAKSFFKVRHLSLNVWVAFVVQSPVTNREANMIETEVRAK